MKKALSLSLIVSVVLWLLLGCVTYSYAAQKQQKGEVSPDSIRKIQDRLIVMYNAVVAQQTDSAKKQSNQTFQMHIQKIFSSSQSMLWHLDSLGKDISIIDAPDRSFRIINWTMYYQKGYYNYYGFIFKKNVDSVLVYPLINQASTLKGIETLTTTNEHWPGALYYDIVVSGDDQNPYYVLLGWDGADLFVNKKLIDVLWFDDNQKPQFGKPVFQIGEELNSRIIFTFSEQTSMQLRWDKKKSMIVFDHLAPSEPQFIGNFEYYVPDATFDALMCTKGIWNLVEDLDVREPKNSGHKRQPLKK